MVPVVDRKMKKPIPPSNVYLNLLIHYAPLWVPITLVLLFLFFVFIPSIQKLSSLNQKIKASENLKTAANRSKADMQRMKKDLESSKAKVAEFEKRLPKRIKTTLIIETLQQITEQAKLKFSSLEPAPIIKYTLTETNDVFVELPVKVKVNCGFYDLVEFLKKIETASQFMKIADLSVKSNPSSEWEHAVEFSVSAFSKGESDE